MNYFTFFRPILLTLSVSRNPIITHLPLSGFLDSLLCVLIAPTPSLAFSILMPCTLAAASSFSSARADPSRSFLPPLSFRLISLNNSSSSLSILNVYAPVVALPRQTAEPTPFLPQFFPPPETSSFWGDFNCHQPLCDSRGTSTPKGRKYSTGSSLLISSPSMTLTHPPFISLLS